jgi:uncharacterized membrane protein YphA (DoxX/SURF4 family)
MTMAKLLNLGRILFATAMAFFGMHYLIYTHGAGAAPGPPWFPGSVISADLTGAALLITGLSIAINLKGSLAALLLGVALFVRVLIVHLPRALVNLHRPDPWTSGFEILALCGGTLALAGALSDKPYNSRSWGRADSTITVGRFLFAIPLLDFGALHFMYARFVATLVPSWIPWHLFWAYFVGVAFFAAALAIIIGKHASLAATLVGLMFLLWVFLLHLPRVAAAPHNANEWTSAFVAVAMSGSGFALAGALEQRIKRSN